jgi:type IV pilus assembly protein PilC
MPRYFFTAKSLKGEEKSGFLEAKDTHQLSQKLHSQGFVLIKAQLAEEETKKGSKLNIVLPSLGGVPLTEKMFFVRNLQVMIAAGLPLPRAIKSLSKQVKNPEFGKALSEIKDKLVEGKGLSESFGYYPSIFPELFKSMIKVGEESGTLENVLKTLSMQMEKEHILRDRVKSAMIYPTIIICSMIAVGALMLIMVVPKLAETFKDLDMELPVTTKIVIGFGIFLANNWHLVFLGLTVLAIISMRLLKIEVVKKIVDSILLKLPIISSIIRSTNSAYTTRNLSSLIGAGVSLPKSLEITSTTLGNYYFRTALGDAAEKVRKGAKFSEILMRHKNIYPSIVIQIIAVGEETGETSRVLSVLADFFEEEVSSATKNLASVIEPVLMIIIGITIGFFAVSMVQPMYSMLGNV